MQSAWHVFDPACLYRAPHHVQSLWGAKSIFITEKGCGASDVIADDGKVYDSDRVMFLRAYLTQLQRATADGVPVHGYFIWSGQDNGDLPFGCPAEPRVPDPPGRVRSPPQAGATRLRPDACSSRYP